MRARITSDLGCCETSQAAASAEEILTAVRTWIEELHS